MSSNPYESRVVHENSSQGIATINLPEMVRASIFQIGILNVFVMLMMGANAQRKLLEEFQLELNQFSSSVFTVLHYWPIVAAVLGIATVGSLIHYRRLHGRPVNLARQWWYTSSCLWLLLIAVLLAGAAPPIYSTITGLAGA